MAKVGVRKAEDDWRELIGGALERIRLLCGLSLKEFAHTIGRDERQVARWIAGTERPQMDAIFAVESFRRPTIVALAELAGDGVEVVTEIRVRRLA
jgi:transcriptional regulator with XRE-family HTH domain